MSFTELLNNPDSKVMVERIEDTLSSLSAYENGEPSLEAVLNSQINELKTATGFEYQV